MIRTEGDWIKENLLQLAREHKTRCNKKDCGVSISAVRIALLRLGIKITDEESEELV